MNRLIRLSSTLFTPNHTNTNYLKFWGFLRRDFSTKELEDNLLTDLFLTEFDPIKYQNFQNHKSISFNFMCDLFETVLNTKGANSKLIQKTTISNFFRIMITYFPASLSPSVHLLFGQITSPYLQLEINVGENTIYKILQSLSEKPKSEVKDLENQLGDLSLTPFSLLKNKSSSYLALDHIHSALRSLASIHGQQSSAKKENLLLQLFKSSSNLEMKYLIRLIQGSLKIGASNQTVIEALSMAVEATPPSQKFPHKSFPIKSTFKDLLNQSFKVCPDIEKIVNGLLKINPSLNFDEFQAECQPLPGMPIQAMGANALKDLNEVTDRFKGEEIISEYKYDGMRGQVHIIDKENFRIFSRGNEDITKSYPDVCETLKKSLKENVQNCIFDCEIVPIDFESKSLRPFSEIQTRKRNKVDINSVKVPVCLFLFDLLYYNNASLLNWKLTDRKSLLFTCFNTHEGQLQFVQSNENGLSEVESFLNSAVKLGCEGLMIKSARSLYEPGNKSLSWGKIKKDYINKSVFPDSLDLVPIGAFFGNGKRKGVFGSFLLACFDKETQEFQTVCKIGTGFSDKDLAEKTEFLKKFEIREPLSSFKYIVKPDVWLRPATVWEIKAADLSISPIHTAGRSVLSKGKGLSIRFPRFIRSREDKTVDQISTSSEIFSYYQKQTLVN